MQLLRLEDFLQGKLPDENERKIMVDQNFAVDNRLQQEHLDETARRNVMNNEFIKRKSILKFFKALILPILIAIFPSFVYYGNNADLLLLASLGKATLLYSFFAILGFIIASIVLKGQTYKAANATFVFLIAFNFYGTLYSFLANNFVLIRHRFLLPFLLFFAFFLSFLVFKKTSSLKFWNRAVLIAGVLIIFNLFIIIPSEIKKNRVQKERSPTISAFNNQFAENDYPDIYFIIFDEFAGVDVAREFWGYNEIDNFIAYAEGKGFYVAQESRGSSLWTLQQISERLNYKRESLSSIKYYELINNNQTVNHLKSHGYIIVTFDETPYWYDAYPPMPADYIYDYEALDVEKAPVLGVFVDEFGFLLADKTMLVLFKKYYQTISLENSRAMKHRDFIRFTIDKLGNLDEIGSPKFVRVHLMLPHPPHIFDEKGNQLPLPQAAFQDWNYYFGQYKFTSHLTVYRQR